MFLTVFGKGSFGHTVFFDKGADTLAADIVWQHDIGGTVAIEACGLFVIVGVENSDDLRINAMDMAEQLFAGAVISDGADDQMGLFNTNFAQ